VSNDITACLDLVTNASEYPLMDDMVWKINQDKDVADQIHVVYKNESGVPTWDAIVQVYKAQIEDTWVVLQLVP
jgi:chitinase